MFARYSFVGSVFAALGALAAAIPDWLASRAGWQMLDALRAMFMVYAAIGAVVWVLYLRMPQPPRAEDGRPPLSLGPSRRIVFKLAGLFSVDSFAGGLVINALLALWLFERFGMSLTGAGAFFFWTGLFSAASQLAAPALARRVGLVNTMVFTHIPASLCLIGAACASSLELALGLARAQPAFANGRAGAQRLRHVRGYAGRACRRGELYRGSAQPCIRDQSLLAGAMFATGL